MKPWARSTWSTPTTPGTAGERARSRKSSSGPTWYSAACWNGSEWLMRQAQPLELQRPLEDRLADHFGQRRAIVRVARRPSPYSSSFSLEEIDVGFADGSDLQL